MVSRSCVAAVFGGKRYDWWEESDDAEASRAALRERIPDNCDANEVAMTHYALGQMLILLVQRCKQWFDEEVVITREEQAAEVFSQEI